FSTPLAVVEHHGRDRNVFAYARQGLHHAHAPCPITCVGNSRTMWCSSFGTDNRRERVTAVTEGHGRKEAAWLFKAQIAVGNRVDITDVSRDHDVFGHCFFKLAQHLTGMEVFATGKWLFFL